MELPHASERLDQGSQVEIAWHGRGSPFRLKWFLRDGGSFAQNRSKHGSFFSCFFCVNLIFLYLRPWVFFIQYMVLLRQHSVFFFSENRFFFSGGEVLSSHFGGRNTLRKKKVVCLYR